MKHIPTTSPLNQPRAIAMWDFSWLERRWPGAGYEDWDLVLDELVERGYDAVRIDAYPHLVAREPEKHWTILPCWNTNDWGSPARNVLQIQPALNQFIRKCRDRGVMVALSSWFQKDPSEWNRKIPSPEVLADIWGKTLGTVAAEGLLDAILYVDVCNEWPFQVWAPFFDSDGSAKWKDARSLSWMQRTISELRARYPDIPYTFSYVGLLDLTPPEAESLSFLDFLEPHLWMVHENNDEFYKRVGYQYARFDPGEYENVVRYAQDLYEADPRYWDSLLEKRIDQAAAESVMAGKALITTECWSIVDYKDWPLLDWNWVKTSCARGVKHAASTGRWAAMATSNFCGPQFVGMWRDIDWHRELTDLIKQSAIPEQESPWKR